MPQDLVPTDLFAFVLVFARIGTALMILPTIGEVFVPPRLRLSIALAVSLLTTPLVATLLPPMPSNPYRLLLIMGGEMGIGAFIGFAGRVMMASLSMAGMVVAYQSALANAFVRSPVAAEQGALAGAFLTIIGLLLIFVTNLHLVMLSGVVESYRLLPPGDLTPVGDIAQTLARLMSRSFVLAMQISAPFLVVGLLFTLGIGLLNRLMPQVQMFFVVMPLQILLGTLVLMLTVSAIMLWFLSGFQDALRPLLFG